MGDAKVAIRVCFPFDDAAGLSSDGQPDRSHCWPFFAVCQASGFFTAPVTDSNAKILLFELSGFGLL